MLQRENHNCTGFLSSLAKENCEKNKQALNIERMGRHNGVCGGREQFSTHISPFGFSPFCESEHGLIFGITASPLKSFSEETEWRVLYERSAHMMIVI